MEELITIVVPIYKVELYLEKCIQSLLNQTYKNLEIILVDDGSPDACGKICDNYAKLDKRIKVMHKINGGLSDARNVGIREASGKYIGFVDSDDFVRQDMYEILYSLIKKNNADISICDFEYVSEENTSTISCEAVPCKNEWQTITGNQAQYLYFNKKQRIIYTVAWNKLYRTDLFQNICYPKGKVHEDEFTTFKLLYIAPKIVTTNEKLYFYLVRKQSIMGEFSKRRFDLLEAYREKIKFYSLNSEKELYKKSIQIYMRMTAQYINWITTDDTGCRQIAENQKAEFAKMYTMTKKKMHLSLGTKMEVFLFVHCLKIYLFLWRFIKSRRGKLNESR